MITADNPYYRQVRLLVRVLPVVAQEECFALKGGTAINLFVRDMTRLSVDIDLAFVPINDRDEALEQIDVALQRIQQALSARPHELDVLASKRQEGKVCGLLISDGNARIKIEVAPVLRGCVYPPQVRTISPSTEAEFGFAAVPVVSFADLYAGKIMAALDRQHPRDLYDVKLLLEAEGISDELFRAFLVYLISHDGAIARVLNPNPKPLMALFEQQFAGMTTSPVTVEELEQARANLIAALHKRIGAQEKEFLISFKEGAPHWELLDIEHVATLPAVRWKLHNLDHMPPDRRREAVDNLKSLLERINT